MNFVFQKEFTNDPKHRMSIPAEAVKALKLKDGDQIRITIEKIEDKD